MFCVLVYSIYHQLLQQPDWRQSLQKIQAAFNSENALMLVAVVLCMIINWSFEARKWQIALRGLQKMSFLKCFKATFTGTTLAFFTPNRMGEYMGRVLYIEEGKRIRAIPLTIVCSMAQLLVTLIAGVCGLLYIRSFIGILPENESIIFWLDILFSIVVAGMAILGLLYFRLSWLVRLVEYIPKLAKYERYIAVLNKFNATLLLRILSLSVFRYLVFAAQYFLLFQVFEVGINWWQAFWSVSVVFLILALVPNVAVLTELGIRWKASIELVQLFSSNIAGILAASLVVWIVNLVIPALIGSLLILGIKVFRNNIA